MRDAKEEEKEPSLIQSVAFGREIERAFVCNVTDLRVVAESRRLL